MLAFSGCAAAPGSKPKWFWPLATLEWPPSGGNCQISVRSNVSQVSLCLHTDHAHIRAFSFVKTLAGKKDLIKIYTNLVNFLYKICSLKDCYTAVLKKRPVFKRLSSYTPCSLECKDTAVRRCPYIDWVLSPAWLACSRCKDQTGRPYREAPPIKAQLL